MSLDISKYGQYTINLEHRTINLNTHSGQSSLCMQAIYDVSIPNGSFIVYMSDDLQVPGAVIKTKGGKICATDDLRKERVEDTDIYKAVQSVEWSSGQQNNEYIEYALVINQGKIESGFDMLKLKTALAAASYFLQAKPPTNPAIAKLVEQWKKDST